MFQNSSSSAESLDEQASQDVLDYSYGPGDDTAVSRSRRSSTSGVIAKAQNVGDLETAVKSYCDAQCSTVSGSKDISLELVADGRAPSENNDDVLKRVFRVGSVQLNDIKNWTHEPQFNEMSYDRRRFLRRAVDAEGYVYTPLKLDHACNTNEFRVFTLMPGEGWEQIRGRITVYSLDSTELPEYSAISYCWSTPEYGDMFRGRTAFVEILDDGERRYIQVPATLKFALKHLRRQHEVIHLWADAICIKQYTDQAALFDRKEKIASFNQMSEIYRRASNVQVWLGELDRSARKAFEFCKRIVDQKGNVRIGRLRQGEKSYVKIFEEASDQFYQREVSSHVMETGHENDNDRGGDGDGDDNGPYGDNDGDDDGDQQKKPRKRDVFSRSFHRMKSHDFWGDGHGRIHDLMRLFHRPWFKRIWVLPEVSYGQQVMVNCGDDHSRIFMDWQVLAIASKVVFEAAKDSGPAHINGHDNITMMIHSTYITTSQDLLDMVEIATLRATIQRAFGHQEIPRPDILYLLNKFRRWNAYHEEDKIYALLTLVDPVKKESLAESGFQVSRSHSNPAEIYRKFAEALLKHTRSLDILNSPKGVNGLSAQLPSWSPDWSNTQTQAGMTLHFLNKEFAASNGSQLDPSTILVSGEFTPTGSIVDNIVAVVDCFWQYEPHADSEKGSLESETRGLSSSETDHFRSIIKFLSRAGRTLKRWAEFADVKATATYDQQKWNVFHKTLALDPQRTDSDQHSSKEAVTASDRGAFERWYSYILKLDSNLESPATSAEDQETTESETSSWTKFLAVPNGAVEFYQNLNLSGLRTGSKNLPQAHYEKYQGCRLARTMQGFLALVPPDACRGDNVALLRGGSVPYIVRPKDMRWELVGCAYVHGLMQGQQWNPESCFRMQFE